MDPKPKKECRNRSGNVRNRKIFIFYIEAMFNFYFSSEKICFLKIVKIIIFF